MSPLMLVDTSVWIESFRKRNPLRLERIVEFDQVVTCLPVIREVLQGSRDDRAFPLWKKLWSYIGQPGARD
jgi:predicted nucleic acid-binding protein